MPRTNKARPNEQINGRPSVTCLRHDVAEAIPIGWWRELEVRANHCFKMPSLAKSWLA
ncbi:MAG: hypothetical protein ACXWPK_20300 [Isosphaeraceae bacterium]